MKYFKSAIKSKESFKDTIEHYGGLLKLDHIGSYLYKSEIDPFISYFSQKEYDFSNSLHREIFKRRGWIDLLVLNNQSINAFAIQDHKNDLICINHGLLLKVRRVIHSLLSCQNFLPKLGDSSLEILNEENNISSYFTQKPVDESTFIFPKCIERAYAADILSIMVYSFIYCHEIGHLTHGHCFLISKLFGTKEYLEFPSQSTSEEENIIRQSLEIQADDSAINDCWELWKDTWEIGENKNIFKNIGKLETFLLINLISLRILDPYGRSNEKKLTTHPNLNVRNMNLFQNFAHYYMNNINNSKLEIQELYVDIAVHLEETLIKLETKSPSNVNFLDEETFDKLESYYNLLKSMKTEIEELKNQRTHRHELVIKKILMKK